MPTIKIPSSDGGALVASRIVSTKPCRLKSLIILNTNIAQQYVQVFESATLPAEGEAPDLPAIPVAAGGVTMFQFGDSGLDLDAVTVCNSSTPDTKTIGSADCAIVAILAG